MVEERQRVSLLLPLREDGALPPCPIDLLRRLNEALPSALPHRLGQFPEPRYPLE